MENPSMVPLSIVLAAALIAAVTDVWKFKVYNTLTLPLMASGLIYQFSVGGLNGLSQGVLGVLFGFFALIFFYVMGGMGAGDVKLLSALGAWLGMPLTFYIFIASSLLGGIYAVLLLVLGGSLGETWVNLQILWFRILSVSRYLGSDDRLERETKRPDRRKRCVPFAAMVAMGTSMTYWLIHQGILKLQ
jgi:prepilin peptidase CpaA